MALFCDGPSRRFDGQREARGVGAAALALAWNRQTEELRRAVRDADGYVFEDAMPVLARAMSVAEDSAVAFTCSSRRSGVFAEWRLCLPRRAL